MTKFRYQIYNQGKPTEIGDIEAIDHWDAVRKLEHLKPDGTLHGGLHWCTLANVSAKIQHHVFPDGSVIDRPINVSWRK